MVDSGTHPSLRPNCQHQTIHCKINLQVEYPPPYQRHVWNNAKANKDARLSTLQNIDWHRLFANKTVHQQVNLLNDIILNVFKNVSPNKFIRSDDRDPPWINDNIKNKIKRKNSMWKCIYNVQIVCTIREMSKNRGLWVIGQDCIWSFSYITVWVND